LSRDRGVHEGQGVIVQVSRDAGGAKGPALTDRPSVVGRYLALTPAQSGVTFSPRLGQGRRRAQLEALMAGIDGSDGLAVRAAASHVNDDAVAGEAASLRREWTAIEQAASEGQAPAVLASPPDLIARVLRDREGGGVAIDDPRAFRAAETLVRGTMPDRRGALRRHDGPEPIFEAYGVADAVSEVCARVVTMASGARLIIDPVEAFTAIDIDSGAGGRQPPDDAALKTNLAVLPEVARQIRLRNISGLIVVDFISMRRKAMRAQFMQAARRAFRGDPVQVDVLGMTAAGLLEITRRRRAPPLEAYLIARQSPAPTSRAAACAVLRDTLRRTGPGRPTVIAAPPIIAALQGPLAPALAETERRLGQPLTLRPAPDRQDWEIILERISC
jgi:ribonuclease G